MIRKILIVLMLAGTFSAYAQVEVFNGFILDTLTTAQLNALPSKVKIKGAHFYNKDISSLVGWNGSAWVAIGGDIADGSITEAKLNTSVNASLDLADSSVQPADLSDYVDKTSNETVGGEKTFTGQTYIGASPSDNNKLRLGYMSTPALSAAAGANYGMMYFQTDGNLTFSNGASAGSGNVEFDWNSNTAHRTYTLPDASGTIALTSDITGSSSLPVDDTTALVQDPSDNTKQVRIDAGAITTSTTRTITMPDADVNLGALTVDNLAANSVGSSEIINQSITFADILDATIKNGKIGNNEITPVKLNSDIGTGMSTDGWLWSWDNSTGHFTLVDPSTLSHPSTAQQYYVIGASAKDTITDADYASAAEYKALFYRNVDTLEVGDGVTYATHGNKPVMVQPTTKDSTYIKKADGVDFFVSGQVAAVTGDGLIVKNRNTAVGYKEGADAWYWSGDLTVHTEAVAPSNLYSFLNAANPDNEANATVGVAYQNAADGTITSVTGGAQNGTYFIRCSNNGNDADSSVVFDITGLTIGQNYTVTFYARESGTNAQLYVGGGFDTSGSLIANIDAVWTQYSFTANATATSASFSIFDGSNTSGDNNDVDNITVIQN